jgi:hypothetical protein
MYLRYNKNGDIMVSTAKRSNNHFLHFYLFYALTFCVILGLLLGVK